MRQRNLLSRAPSADEARELNALERALAGEPADAASPDAGLRELEDLVREIRAAAPQMSPGFAARLDHAVAEGFPVSAEQPARHRSRRRLLVAGAGSLAAAIAALAVVLGPISNDNIISTSAQKSTPVQEDRSSRKLDSAGAGREASPAPQAGGRVPAAPAPAAGAASPSASRPQLATPPISPKGPRRVQRSADLVLAVAPAKLDSTADRVIRTVDRFGGIVASSAIGSDDDTGEATFDLRIPTERLDDALAALSKLGHVAERRQELTDITASFSSAQERLSDARAERRGLLRALGRASTKAQIDSLRGRLRNVRSQIARLNGDLEALRRRADLSRVSVTVRGDDKQSGDDGAGGSWSPGDAAHDALRVLEVIAGATLIALAVAAPLGLLALLSLPVLRSARRRRREGALDHAQ